MVRAHRQAWCWQDEWYGLTIENIRQLELETQLALATKMAQYCQVEEATEANGSAPSPDKEQEAKEAISSIEADETVTRSVETLQPRGVLTKQWSTSSRSSRSSKRGGERRLQHVVSSVQHRSTIACFPFLPSSHSSHLYHESVIKQISLHRQNLHGIRKYIKCHLDIP